MSHRKTLYLPLSVRPRGRVPKSRKQFWVGGMTFTIQVSESVPSTVSVNVARTRYIPAFEKT